jgi:phosphopentomutase
VSRRAAPGIERAVVVVLDGVGVGALPDADAWGDAGADTLGHVAAACGGLRLPALTGLGLGLVRPDVLPAGGAVEGAWGALAEVSAGKDTSLGHWELMGVEVREPFAVFPAGFPADLVAALERAFGRGVLCNAPASGTAVLEDFGARHLASGSLILYTSADSVLQLAGHADVLPVEELYECCRRARSVLDERGVRLLRVIARPFRGAPGGFERIAGRRDFSLPPPRPTLLERLSGAGWPVLGVGKVRDIFVGSGLDASRSAAGNDEAIDEIVAALGERRRGLIFANVNDFDTLYGHRNDAPGFGRALEEFDRALGARILPALGARDLLVVTADHGCDPLHPGTDHTREYAPVLAWRRGLGRSIALGTRRSHADVAATLSEAFLGAPWTCGESFWGLLRPCPA